MWDIETFACLFFVGIYNPETRQKYGFSVSEYENQLDGLFKFLEVHKDYFFCGFNSIKFDGQVIEWIARNYEQWNELSGLEICAKIAQKANDVIDNSNYGLFSEYREDQMGIKHVDLGCIHHFFGEQKMTSLKSLEFSMDMENIEELPLHHMKLNLSKEEIDSIIRYCFNDIDATYNLYLYTIGEVDNILYKGQNKILDREIIEEETGLKCLNWDDVKIGAEWNKLDYISLTGKNEWDLKPKKVNHFYGKKYKQFFPKTVKFQTKELKQFIDKLGDTFITNKKQEFDYKFNDTLTVTIARGGIHSNEKPRFVKPTEDEIYYQVDIGSQYPNALRKYKIYPSHLGIEWNEMLLQKIERRLKYKKLAKETKDRKYESLQEMGKLSLNGGAYGRLNTQGDWQEDPCAMLKTTMGCQLEILMIVEDLILKNFNVISCNTDGFDLVVDRKRDQELRDILSNFEKLIGNDILGNFEYTEFLWIAQLSVNGYIAQKREKGVKDDGIKKKKEFLTDYELYKNKSCRIVPLALEQYYINNVSVEQFIKNHKNIYNFCIRQKSSRDFHYQGISKNGTNVYKKLIRYYVSLEGEEIFKIKEESCQTNASPRSIIEKNEDTGRGYKLRVCNFLSKDTKVEEAGIDFDYYISKARKIIEKIEYGGRKIKKQPINQISLW